MSPLAVAVVVAAQSEEAVEPLAGKSILIVLAIIVAIGFAIVLAGMGYFTPDD